MDWPLACAFETGTAFGTGFIILANIEPAAGETEYYSGIDFWDAAWARQALLIGLGSYLTWKYMIGVILF